jgi:hypothetical protein
MPSKNYGQNGVGSTVELGKAGPKIKNSSGVIEHRNNADDAYAIARGAHPVGDNDFVTKFYMETKANVYASGQIDGGSPPAAGTPGRIFICTTAGGAYTLKYLYRDDGSDWDEEIVPVEGMIISITDALTGGTDEYLADHLYLWNEDASSWVDIGPGAAASEVVKSSPLQFDYTDSGANLIKNVPSGSRIIEVMVNVTQVFDGTTPTAEVGDVSDSDRFMITDEIDLETVGLYTAKNLYLYGASTDVNLTLTVSGASQGQATVLLTYALA